MTKNVNHILFDCERTKYPNTGLFYYCKYLGNALLALADSSKEQFTLYLRKENLKYFHSINMMQQNDLHKFIFPDTKKFNIWHCTYQGSNYNPAGKHLKKVLTIHDLNFLHEPDVRLSKIKREQRKLQARIDQFDHLVFISKFVQNDVMQHLDIKNKPHTIIYNGSNLSEEKGEVNEPSNKITSPFLFTIGTLTYKKNFHVLLHLLPGSQYKLVIAGVLSEPEYVKKIYKLAEELHVSDRVIITGEISNNDKMWYMRHCTAFVFPSLAEGFGLPVIEAMNYGKAVFLSRFTSLPEIGGDQAYYFDSFEPAAMRECLEKGLSDYRQRNPQVAIREWANSFNWGNAAKKYLQIYRNLI